MSCYLDPAGQVMRQVYGRIQVAYLYPLHLTTFRAVASPRQLVALATARLVQQICPTCRRDAGYRIPTRYGECIRCAERRAA